MVANRRRCSFPGCVAQQLHDITHQVRYKVMKHRKIFIPNGARACDQHLSEISWNVIDRNTVHQSKYTANQLENLIELLRNSGSNMVTKIPG